MKILAVEFSSARRSVAVVQGAGDGPGPKVMAWEADSHAVDRRQLSSLGLVTEALGKAGVEREEIEGVAVGIGPGSYTGIRVAIALAQGWQLARGVRLLAISSAECLAAQAQAEGLLGRVEVVIDAQRGEVYLAGYEISAGDWRETEALRLGTLAQAQERQSTGWALAGPEVTRWFPEGRVLFPTAATLGGLALGRSDFIAGEALEPLYLRQAGFVKQHS